MIFTLAGVISFDKIDPNVLIEHFEDTHPDILRLKAEGLSHLEKTWQANRGKCCIITVKDVGTWLYQPIFGSDVRSESRIFINDVKREIYAEIQDAKIGAENQGGIPAELIYTVVQEMLLEDKTETFFKGVAPSTNVKNWFKAFNFRYPTYGRENGTMEQIWHLPRKAFLQKFLTLEDVKTVYRNGLGQIKTFDELLPTLLNIGGMYATLEECLFLMKDSHPELRKNLEKVFLEMKKTRAEIESLRDKCEQLFDQI